MAGLPLAADGFEAFTLEHAVLLGLLVLGAITLGVVGCRQAGAVDPWRFRRTFALVIPVFTVPFQVLQLLPDDFTLGTSLPLQVCDLSWMVAVYALWTRDGRAIGLLYFWGLTLTVQAAITPSLGQTFPDPRYFMFWGMHFLTIWASVYLVCLVGGPGWSGYRFTLWCTAVWAAVVLAFNAVTGMNYGYLSRKPETSSLLDLLGPWPAYVAAEVAVLVVGWALMTWPWVHGARTVPEQQNAGDRPPEHGHRRPPPDLSAGRPPPGDPHERPAGEQRAETSGQEEW
jgi:hypothetical integral membrane protein (TIGR02206 family)